MANARAVTLIMPPLYHMLLTTLCQERFVIARCAKRAVAIQLDCFVALLLAMTAFYSYFAAIFAASTRTRARSLGGASASARSPNDSSHRAIQSSDHA